MAKPPKDDAHEDHDAPAPIEGEGGGEVDPLGDDGKKKFSAKKILLFVVLPLLLLIGGGGAGLYFTGKLDKMLGKAPVEGSAEAGAAVEAGKAKEKCKDKPKAEKAEGGHGAKKEGGEKKAASADGCDTGEAVFLEIPNMLVNLSGPDDQPRYLRLKVQLELANDNDMEAVKAVLPRVVDQFQTYLRELRIKDLRGSAGIYRLQMELLSRVNAAAYPTEVKDVLFQEILIQ